MANGLKRVSNAFRNMFDMDAGEVSRFRARVRYAADNAEPVRKSELKTKITEYVDIDINVLSDTPAGDFLVDLSNQVADAMDAADDGVDAQKLLTAARAENKRAERGLDLRGGGEYPLALWNRARRVAQRVDDGLISTSSGLELIGRRNLHEDALCDILGRFLAAYDEACEQYGELAKADREADRRAREHAVVGRINVHDNQRRARIAGRDVSVVASDEIARALTKVLPELMRALEEGAVKTEIRRPKAADDVEVVEMDA